MLENKFIAQIVPIVSTSAIIRLENISKVYGAGETEVRALADVNLTVESG